MSETETFNPVPTLSNELKISQNQISAVLTLFADGNTVPFIARYRKEVTGSLDEVQIRTIEERHEYLQELNKRRETILKSIEEQGKLSEELKAKILSCQTKSRLEDLYLPYKPKRRTRATIAKEKGLEPLAQTICAQGESGNPVEEATAFINAEKEVADADAALAGARDIVAEWYSENAEVRGMLRDYMEKEGTLVSEPVPEKTEKPTKYEQYYKFKERLAKIPSHRFLAIRRGEREGILKVKIELESEPFLNRSFAKMEVKDNSPFAEQMKLAIQDGYQRLLVTSVEKDIAGQLKNRSDEAAVDVFAQNLRHLLLSAPLGGKGVIGIDPGLRTGCKCVAVDNTGKYLDTMTIFPTQGEAKAAKAKELVLEFVKKYNPIAIAIGNGTGGRETELFVKQVLKEAEITEIIILQVNESGASVYSASDIAREEFPKLDLTIRGAISIARRLQDPLAELVKIEPKSIGVGQYQHDVHQPLLQKKLGEVVESCVNHVGVELNTASASLLSYVAGIGPALAKKIVKHREEQGAFKARQKLLDISGLGPKAFQQAAGFLRIRDGENPLDTSAVHPERYELVETIAKDMGIGISELLKNEEAVNKIEVDKYVSDNVGLLTLQDIISELKKPGLDPRNNFEPPQFRDDVTDIKDLEVGMEFEGIITNVTAFGVFIDIGVHQDGLVHISQLTDKYIKSPSEVVSVGDKLKVKVLEVDTERKRISLTARSGQSKERGKRYNKKKKGKPHHQQGQRQHGKTSGKHQSQGSKGHKGGHKKQERPANLEKKLSALEAHFNSARKGIR